MRIGRVAIAGEPRVTVFQRGPQILPGVQLFDLLDADNPADAVRRLLPRPSPRPTPGVGCRPLISRKSGRPA